MDLTKPGEPVDSPYFATNVNISVKYIITGSADVTSDVAFYFWYKNAKSGDWELLLRTTDTADTPNAQFEVGPGKASAVYFYQRKDNQKWEQIYYKEDLSEGMFGNSVSIDGTYAVMGNNE